ncbi:transmembrane protein, putative [Bodo saltans]|uniref:Transmembrane protein, putative n=1 Tax=Bodo saltans TaxID=75058 RepID=A0A0S4IYZ0_BODSA|nr:transmembrane protein, putative [Bodo saltans]|eukprot:CUG13654.1 transmembrane protein, putative [Bodo saltans]
MASFTELPGFMNNLGGGEDDDEDFVGAPEASTNKDIEQNHVNELANLARRKQREAFREYLHSIPKPDLHLDANVMDLQRNSVMHLVVMSCDLGILKAALECGASVNVYENEDKETPLALAAQIFPDGFVLMLHDAKKPKAKRVNSIGQNLLHAVVTAKATARPWPERLAMVRELVVQHSVSIKQQDENGYTPSAWARQHYLGLGGDADQIIELLSKSQSKRMNASKAEFVTFYKSPVARLLFVAILITLHSLQYATEMYDRPSKALIVQPVWYEVLSNGSETRLGDAIRNSDGSFNITYNPYNVTYNVTSPTGNETVELRNDTYIGYPAKFPAGNFPFCFMAFNMIGSQWFASTNIIAAHVGMLFGGVVLGAILVMLLLRDLLGKQILSLRIFGADADRLSAVMSSAATTAASDEVASSVAFMADDFDHPASSHGSAYMILAGAIVGMYCGALSLNAILESAFKHQNGSAFLITNTIDAVDGVGLLRAAWVISLMFDWFVFILVLDTMLQLLSTTSNSSFVPDPAYNGFASGMYPSLPTWRRIWWYGATLLGWLGLFIGFGVKSHNDGAMAFVEPLIDTASVGQQLAIVSLSIMITFVVISQDWLLPYRKHTVELVVPFLQDTRSNLMWLMWFCCSITMALDMRLFVGLLWRFVDTQDLSKPLKRFELAMVLLPCALGIFLFLTVLIRTSTRLSPAARRSGDDETRSQSAVGANGPTNFKSSDARVGRQQQRSPIDKPLTSAFAGDTSALGGGGGVRKAAMPSSLRAVGANRVFDENAPIRPPSNATGRKTQANDIWVAAATDDVVKMCTLLEKDPTLVNQRGGPGIECDALSRTITVMPPGAQAGAEYAAAPIHYAIASNARGTLTALLSRGANARLRTVHGMFSCREMLEIIGNKEMLDVMYPSGGGGGTTSVVPPIGGGGGGVSSPTGALSNMVPRKSFHRSTPRGATGSEDVSRGEHHQLHATFPNDSAYGSPQFSQQSSQQPHHTNSVPLTAAQLQQLQQVGPLPTNHHNAAANNDGGGQADLATQQQYQPPQQQYYQQQQQQPQTHAAQTYQHQYQQPPSVASSSTPLKGGNQPPMRRELQLKQLRQQQQSHWQPYSDELPYEQVQQEMYGMQQQQPREETWQDARAPMYASPAGRGEQGSYYYDNPQQPQQHAAYYAEAAEQQQAPVYYSPTLPSYAPEGQQQGGSPYGAQQQYYDAPGGSRGY